MSDETFVFTGYVTSIDFSDDKFYITVTKKLFDAYSEPNRLVIIDTGVEFWTTNLRDIYNAYSAFIAKEERKFVIPHDHVESRWCLEEE